MALAKLVLLLALQLVPVILFIFQRKRPLLAVHLGGLFLFTTWKRFFFNYVDLPATDILILATLLILSSYTLVSKICSNKEPVELTLPALSYRTILFLSTCLLLSLHPFFSSARLNIPVLALQFLACSILIIHEGAFSPFGKVAVLLYFFLYFLIREGSQLGLELFAMTALALCLRRRVQLLPFLAVLSLLVLFLEMAKPSFRTLTYERNEIPLAEKARLFANVVLSAPRKHLSRLPTDKRLSVNDHRIPLGEEYPRLTDLRIRRTLFPSQWDHNRLKDLGVVPQHYELLYRYMPLLVSPLGVLNPLLIVDLPKKYTAEFLKEDATRSFDRIGDSSLDKVVAFTPHLIPYAKPTSYLSILTLFVPRLFWKDKPNFFIWNEFGRRYYILRESDNRTSVSFTYLAESYMIFGMKGILIASLLMGSLLGLLDSKTRTYTQIVVLASVFVLPFDSFTILAKLLHRGGGLWFLTRGIKEWKKLKTRASVKAPKEQGLKNYHPLEPEITLK